jgi:hypothetical protein
MMSSFAGNFFAVAAIAALVAQLPTSYVLAAAGLAVVAYALRASDSVQR